MTIAGEKRSTEVINPGERRLLAYPIRVKR